MKEEPKGTTLEGLDEELRLPTGPINTTWGGEQVNLTRKIAISVALSTYVDAKKADKFIAFDIGVRLHNANGTVAISGDESTLIKLALEAAWPQPGIYVPLCRWLEGA